MNEQAGKIVVVTGGARSGKSAFAERYAERTGEAVAYIATAQVYDDEMQERVTLHQQRRPAQWTTFEAPYAAEAAIREAARQHPVILFDCLTVYVSNLLLKVYDTQTREQRQQYVLSQLDTLLAAAAASQATVIFVTNEVGMGIVPENALAREYRDLAGWVNQKAAVWAAEVYLTACGLAVDMKKLAVKEGGSHG